MEKREREEKVKKAIESSNELVYKVNDRIYKKFDNFFLSILDTFLVQLNKENLKEPLNYCLREMMDNAEKANVKRIYFLEKKLNIYDSKNYDEGMKTFRSDFMNNLDYYFNKIKLRGFFVRIIFQVKDDYLIIKVCNNSLMTNKEKNRITDRIMQAKKIKDAYKAFTMFGDEAESQGIGIVTIILMLRKLGMDDDSFIFSSEDSDRETITGLSVNLSSITEDQAQEISRSITDEITSIPKFPDVIMQLESMLRDVNISFFDVARAIMRDPSLTADLLKWVNSVQYMLPNKVSSIREAVTLVGVKGIRSMLYSYSVQKIMNQKYGDMKKIWDHSYKVAYYSHQLARMKRKNAIVEDIYTAAILHDMGKIIISHLHPNTLEKLNKFCKAKGIKGNFIESFTLGVTHSTIGAMLARKWNFDEKISMPIEFHHQPLLCPDEYKDIVYIVYLADFIVGMEEGIKDWDMAVKEVIIPLDILSEDQLIGLKDKLGKMYENQMERSGN